MEGDFRNTLIIISAVIIAVIFIHGFITIRRNKNPYKLKTTNEKIEPLERGFDGSGFDQDGVSKPRVIGDKYPSSVKPMKEKSSHKAPVKKANKVDPSFPSFFDSKASANTEDSATKIVDDANVNNVENVEEEFQYDVNETESTSENVSANQHKSTTADISLTDSGVEHLNTDIDDASIDIGDDIADFDYGVTDESAAEQEPVEEVVKKPEVIQKPLYETPITRPKPEREKITTAAVTPKAKNKPNITKKESVKRNQIELNFGDPIDTSDMPSMSAIDSASKVEKQKKLEPLEPEVLVISIVMPEGQVISGAELLPTLLTLGLRYGDMDIFHRHQDNAGNGKVTFSLANIMNPGTFDLDALESFTTCGLTFFMTLPNAGDAFEVFGHMIGAAKQISVEFGAQLLDDKRSVMTKQTEQHYISKIREFERKNRIALSEINSRN
ncbi:cell division protein ZipA [Pseudocolwellia sp. HL-MZ19]|uniref:cell division protein ZipA n=1 Tax=unclassified Pseudocolwellia TaxID=2848178 RepID=UPI003CE788DC